MAERPEPSSPLVSRTMKKVRVRDTEPEMAVRRLLFASGLRYRVNYRPKEPDIGRSTIDITFPAHHLAVFIDGCFWHCCAEHGEIPKANRKWWEQKFSENKARDERITRLLETGGWQVLRFWSHEVPENVCERIVLELNRTTS